MPLPACGSDNTTPHVYLAVQVGLTVHHHYLTCNQACTCTAASAAKPANSGRQALCNPASV